VSTPLRKRHARTLLVETVEEFSKMLSESCRRHGIVRGTGDTRRWDKVTQEVLTTIGLRVPMTTRQLWDYLARVAKQNGGTFETRFESKIGPSLCDTTGWSRSRLRLQLVEWERAGALKFRCLTAGRGTLITGINE